MRVFGNRLNLFPIFVFLFIFVFPDFVFKIRSQTPCYSGKTCFVVLKTESVFKTATKQAISILISLGDNALKIWESSSIEFIYQDDKASINIKTEPIFKTAPKQSISILISFGET
jgi:hypothetical protein